MSSVPPPLPRKPAIGDTRPPPGSNAMPNLAAVKSHVSADHKQKVIAVVDGPNLDMVLSGLIGRRPEKEDRPVYGVLYRWIAANAAGEDGIATDYFEYDDALDISACIFLNVRPDSLTQVTAFASYLVKDTAWSVAVKNTGDQPLYDRDRGDEDRIDIDPDILEYLKRHIPTNQEEKASFYVMTCDVANVRDSLIGLAQAGHNVNLVCYPDTVNTRRLQLAGVNVIDLRDIPQLFNEGKIPPLTVDLKDLEVGEIVFIPSALTR